MKRMGSYSNFERSAPHKRRRVEEFQDQFGAEEQVPRKVLHLRGFDDEIEASDIVQFAIPFGKIRNMVFAKKSHQALLEMESLQAAKSMVSHYRNRPPRFGRKTIFIQFSNHNELDKDLSVQHVSVIKAVQAANNSLEATGRVTPVLRVIIENKSQPVTLHTLKQIFSRFGDVQKIVTFIKNSTWQALIQMADLVAAQNARTHLNGMNVYDGCCTLKIDYSKQESLKVRYNNEKSYDFTNPNLSSGDMEAPFNPESGIFENPISYKDALDPSLVGPGGQLNVGGLGNINPVAAAQLQILARQLSSLEGVRGSHAANILETLAGISAIGSLQSNVAGFEDYKYGGESSGNSNNGLFGRRRFDDERHTGRGRDIPVDYVDSRVHERPEGFGTTKPPASTGRVILVSNLNEEKVSNTDAIFVLFGVYGNVIRVKILYNKKDSALVEYEEDYQAHNAVENLNRVRWNDKTMSVMMSKHSSVKMPKDTEEVWLTKDYSGSKLHRYRRLGSKNHKHIFPPSSTLHLSNIPSSTTEQDLTDLFKEYGNVLSFKFNPNDRKIAWIKMDSVQTAIEALVGLHDHELGRTANLRVSFTGHKL